MQHVFASICANPENRTAANIAAGTAAAIGRSIEVSGQVPEQPAVRGSAVFSALKGMKDRVCAIRRQPENRAVAACTACAGLAVEIAGLIGDQVSARCGAVFPALE